MRRASQCVSARAGAYLLDVVAHRSRCDRGVAAPEAIEDDGVLAHGIVCVSHAATNRLTHPVHTGGNRLGHVDQERIVRPCENEMVKVPVNSKVLVQECDGRPVVFWSLPYLASDGTVVVECLLQ